MVHTFTVGLFSQTVSVDAGKKQLSIDFRSRDEINENAMSDSLWMLRVSASFKRLYVGDFSFMDEKMDDEARAPTFVNDIPAILVKVTDDAYVFTGDGDVVRFKSEEPILSFSTIYGSFEYGGLFSFALTANHVLMLEHAWTKQCVWSAPRSVIDQKLVRRTSENGLTRWIRLMDVFQDTLENTQDWTRIVTTTLLSNNCWRIAEPDYVHPHLNMSVHDWHKASRYNPMADVLILQHLLRRTILGSNARRWLCRRNNAARTIQKAWRVSVSNPAFTVCNRRLMREFEDFCC